MSRPDELPDADEESTLDGTDGKAKKPAAKPTEPAESPVDPPAPKHPARLMRLAENAGIPAAEAEAMTKAQLLEEIEYADKLAEQERRHANLERAARATPPPAPATPAAPSGKTDLEEQFGVELDEEIEVVDETGVATGKKRKATAKDFSPSVLKILTAQGKAIKELVEKAGALTKSEETRQRKMQDDMLDAVFEAMGPRWEKVFGKGKASGLIGTPALAKRISVVRQAGVDWTADGPAELKKKVTDTANPLYGDLIEPEEPAKPADAGGGVYSGATPAAPPKKEARQENARRVKADEWANSHSARATQRNGAAEPKGTAAATKAVAAKMKEAGLDPGPVERAEEEDELPE